MVQVFVYGTLKPGEYYFPQYCEGRVIAWCEAIAPGLLYDLPMGYPAMTPGDGTVHGVVLTFSSSTVLNELDELEDFDPNRAPQFNEYNRVQMEVVGLNGALIKGVWAYVMEAKRVVKVGGVLIPDGRWTGRHLAPPVR